MTVPPPCRKAVIPAAGFGTRFLPFTKAVPKELIPLVDKPVIQYVVEEAVASGLEEVLVVLSTGKEAIADHFNPAPALEARLSADGKERLLTEVRALNHLARIHYVYQAELNGLGDAIRCAAAFVGNEPFAVLLGDTVLTGDDGRPVTGQLLQAYRKTGGPVVALEEVPREWTRRYGVISGQSADGALYELDSLVEKPAPEEAPSNLAIASRYVFTPDLFAALERTPRGKGNEIQLTDAMLLLLRERPLFGLRFAGRRHDIGDKFEFLKNTVTFGLERPEFRDRFAAFLRAELSKLEGSDFV